MATWASLTAEQRDIVGAWQNMQRGWASQQAKANDLGQQVDTAYNAQVSPLNLGGTEVIPNTSGLAGAQSLVYNDAVSIESHIQAIATSYNDTNHRLLWAKACGAGNL
jgi:hypothetical protein